MTDALIIFFGGLTCVGIGIITSSLTRIEKALKRMEDKLDKK